MKRPKTQGISAEEFCGRERIPIENFGDKVGREQQNVEQRVMKGCFGEKEGELRDCGVREGLRTTRKRLQFQPTGKFEAYFCLNFGEIMKKC